MGDAGETIEEKIVGYLHDVVEDSHITITDLSEHGFSDSILSAVDAITRRKSESWRKYMQRVGDNSIAAKVKINDLKHNSDLSRIASPGEVDLSRQRKYQAAIANLLENSCSIKYKNKYYQSTSNLHKNTRTITGEKIWR
ncbi:GTP pyrophosphokinase [Enterococcus hulanensis]|uniref:GTP pyrophosphokinase n=1 Tax=Enterococcus hulanensis TaxID=2559929 RepID=UPI0028918352|nr:GTP pyrophosphokinase [Enterococcus hulanensis]MDT2658949.1 GTP pyrophosphokinase [Enterococcus hulanensis]